LIMQKPVMSTILFVLVFMADIYGQVVVHPKKINYGVVSASTERVVDIIIDNPKDKSDFLLRIENSHELDVIYSSKTLEPGGQITVRVKLNPRYTGPFKEDLKLHFGSLPTPIIVPISAEVEFLNPADNIPCPSFNERAADCCPSNMFLVEVFDKVSGKPLKNAIITITQEGKEIKKFMTRETGAASQSVNIAYYNLSASLKGYNTGSVYTYINNQNHYFRFDLEKDPNQIIEEIEEEISVLDTTSISLELPENIYKPNNIVFLVDVSTSMSTGDKMNLAKKSMSRLADVLREVDNVSVISYAGDTEVLIENANGADRGQILQVLEEMKAYGMTAGANGFKRAFQMLKEHEIVSGNNQLIVITDGAFKTTDQESIKKLVKRYAKRNYKTSIVGIKASNYAAENLREVSFMGSGTFVEVDNIAEAESAILEEIKRQSAKQ